MTKKLEELFNLEENIKSRPDIEIESKEHEQITDLDKNFQQVQEITKSLPVIPELDNLDEKELDDLAKKAENAYDDLMDLGMNVEVRYSGRIFEVAGTMMKNAIDAKSAKIEKKLKAIDLQLKKYKIDKDFSGDDNSIPGEAYIISDRNDLLKKLAKKD
jgi:hypothetical protein